MQNPKSPIAAVAVGALSLCLSPIANGGVLVLKNGDRITGEISAIWDHEITIEPTYSDEFKVDSEVVAYIESNRKFDIELADGREFSATLKGANEEGEQIFVVDGNQIAAPFMQLYELDEIDDPVDWDTYIDLSSALNRGNTVSSNNKLAADSTLVIGDHRHIGDLSIIREDHDGIATKEQDLIRYNYNWLFRDPWFFSAAVSLERDPIRDLDRRAVVTAGMGRDIWNNPRQLLNFQLGVGVITEEIESSSELKYCCAMELKIPAGLVQ